MFCPRKIFLLETTNHPPPPPPGLPSKLVRFAVVRSLYVIKIMQIHRFRFHLRYNHAKNDYA